MHAITAQVVPIDDQLQLKLAAFPIMQFLDQCLNGDSTEFGVCEANTLDAIVMMLRTQFSMQIDTFYSEKYVHMCALVAACSLKRYDVCTATFFADEASRLINTSWHSLRLKRSCILEPMEVADFIVVCQCALLNMDFIAAQRMCLKIIDAGKGADSYFCHSILHHGHVLKAITSLLHGTVRSSSFHLECAKAFCTSDDLDAPAFVPELR